MNVGDLQDLASGFVTLLLLPTLGVLGLMQKRAIPVLGWTLALWTVLGGTALYAHHTFQWSQNRFLHGWLMGLGLGTTFLIIALMRNNPRIAPWLKFGLALVTLAVFAQSLLRFLERYA
jgi:hypothetical protein